MVGGRYKVSHNPLWTVPNAPLGSAQGKELHPPILSMLAMHGGQVNRETERGFLPKLISIE